MNLYSKSGATANAGAPSAEARERPCVPTPDASTAQDSRSAILRPHTLTGGRKDLSETNRPFEEAEVKTGLTRREQEKTSSETNRPFEGRVGIVTGATRGIGRALALELARRGSSVAFNYARSAEAAETLTAELEALGVKSLSAQCDVAQTEAAAEMVKQVKD